MKLRHLNKNPGTPNIHALCGTGFAAAAALTWPGTAGGFQDQLLPAFMGFLAVVLASVNIFGGFIVTQRMLQMYKKKKK